VMNGLVSQFSMQNNQYPKTPKPQNPRFKKINISWL
jgi:hypothetical protein